jgi:hypothetical protein
MGRIGNLVLDDDEDRTACIDLEDELWLGPVVTVDTRRILRPKRGRGERSNRQLRSPEHLREPRPQGLVDRRVAQKAEHTSAVWLSSRPPCMGCHVE